MVCETRAVSLRDWLLMSVVALTWSGGWIASKVGVTNAPPIALSAVRFVVAGAILLLIARATGARIPWTRWPGLVAIAVSGIAAYNALVFVGLVFAPASDGALIVPTFTPILAAMLAVLFANEPLTREGLVGLGYDPLEAVEPELRPRDHTEVAAAAADRPVEIRILFGAGGDKAPIRQHHVHREEIINRQSALAGQVSEAAPQSQASHAGRRDDAAGGRHAEGVSGVVHVAPDTPTLRADRTSGRVHADALHAAQVNDQASVADS